MTKPSRTLRDLLSRLDGRPYPAYKGIRGNYQFAGFELFIDHVQGDPFASPSRLRVRVPSSQAGFPPATRSSPARVVGLRDFLARAFASAASEASHRLGSGKSGLLYMNRPGQEILERSSVAVTEHHVEARFQAGLPAQGRRILGRQAGVLLCDQLPEVVARSLHYQSFESRVLEQHLDAAEDAEALRAMLAERRLVAFVADGASLPRRSGVDDRPLLGAELRRFQSPESLRQEVTCPHAGRLTGMGIPEGVTLIVGGGYHGKSTLLQAIERGVYNHIPGDGREQVVTESTAVKIRAEDGRRIEGVDLTPFIDHLPGQGNPALFRSENASGSTSQAANIMEALEVGTRTLLLDEDTCATNLMIRDARMQELVEKSGEPITALVDRIRQLAKRQVSSVLVLGGSGDYFEAADTVIRMDAFEPRDVTAEAKAIATRRPTGRQVELESPWPESLRRRIPVPRSLDPSKGRREVSIRGRALRALLFGTEEIDLSFVSQLVDEGQVKAIGKAMDLARRQLMSGPEQDMASMVGAVLEAIGKEGLDVLDPRLSGELVAFRPYELAAAINRLRSLLVKISGNRASVVSHK